MKVFKFFIVSVCLLAVVFGFSTTAKAVTVQELMDQIAELQAQVQALQGQQTATAQPSTSAQGPTSTTSWCHTFNQNLAYGNAATAEVGYLHTALDREGLSYSPDTGNTFREATILAVTIFQERYTSEILAPYGLIHGTGYVGETTRAKLNELYGCGAGETGLPTITLTSLNGGERLIASERYNITWITSNFLPSDTVSITLFDDSVNFSQPITFSAPASVGYYLWMVPQALYKTSNSSSPEGITYKIKVSKNSTPSATDYSDEYFSIQIGNLASKYVSLISPAKYSYSDIKDPENPLEIRWSTGFESSGPSLPLTVDNKLNIILVKDRCFDPIMSGGPGPKSIGKYMVIGSGIPKGQVYYQWKISEEFINLMGEGDCKFKLWIGEYKPPSQSGDWDSINMYTSSPAYGVFDESAVRITTKAEPAFFIISPMAGQIVKIGDTLKIETFYAGSGIGSPDIFLINGDNSDITPIFTHDWLKIYMWKIPSTVKPGKNYYIHTGTSYLQGGKLTLSSDGLRSGRFTIEDPSKTQKYISMTSPETGTVLDDPNTIDIKWSSQNIDKVNIYLVKSVRSTGILFGGGGSFTFLYYFTIASEVPASDGHYVWNIPDEIERSHLRQGASKYSISVGEWRPPDTNGTWEDFGTIYGAYANYSASVVGYAYTANLFPHSAKGNIVIFRQSVTINNPNHNQSLTPGDTINVSWSIDNREPEIGTKTMIFDLYDTLNQKIVGGIAPKPTGKPDYCVSCYNDIPIQQGSYTWTIPTTLKPGNSYIIVMVPSGGGTSSPYVSNVAYYLDTKYAFSEPFTITSVPPTSQASITVTSPNGGETWKQGETHNITWTSSGLHSGDKGMIRLFDTNNSIPPAFYVDNISMSDGLYTWTIPSNITPGLYKIEIYDTYGASDYRNGNPEDMSNNYFTIATASTCTPEWSCGDWSACANNQQTRTCTDLNNCGVTTGKPAESQTCTTTSCSQLYSKITASYLKSCSDAAYDPAADIDKSKKVDLGDMSFYSASMTDQAWCQQKLSETTSPCPIINWCHTFNQNLGYTNSGSTEIGYLHTALDREGISYAPDIGNIFGQGTSSAIVNFQEKYVADILTPYSLVSGTGYVGNSTRAKLNVLYGCTATCTPNWQCSEWSACVSGQQTKTCTDSNNCGVTTGKPVESQACTATCTPNWQCSVWSACANSLQTRTCPDTNNCGVTTGKPAESQACTAQPSITVTSPNGGETWKQGETHNITWTSNGVKSVSIYLRKAGKIIKALASCAQDTGTYSYALSSDITKDTDYEVTVSYCTLNSGFSGPAEDTSDDFTITDEPATTTYCSQFYSKLTASYNKKCGEAAYDPLVDVDKDGDVDSGDQSFYAAHTTDQAWCQQKLSETTSPCPIINWCHTFTRYLTTGSTDVTSNGEVLYLQTALAKQGFGVGADSTGVFGYGTAAAVVKFQKEYNITQTGTVGPVTRAKLNALYGCSPTCVPNWQCSVWSACANSLQTRTCPDTNNCGVTTGKPAESQACTTTYCSQLYSKLIASNAKSYGVAGYDPAADINKDRIVNSEDMSLYSANMTNEQWCLQKLGAKCTPNWQCSAWSACTNGQQTKTCPDTNNCGVTTGKPAESQACIATCTPNWQCSVWSACANSLQTRTCPDTNNCGVTAGKPTESQACTAQPSITVTSPNGGQTWQQGETHSITWTSTGVSNVIIQLYKGAYYMVSNLAYSVPASAGSFSWTIPTTLTPGSDYKVKIWDTPNYSIVDSSDNYFTISSISTCTPNWQCSGWSSCVNGQQTQTCTDSNNCGTTAGKPFESQTCTPQSSIALTSPNGGQTWQQGETHSITWTSTGVSNVIIQLYKGSYIVSNLTYSVPASAGSFSWAVPTTITPGSDYKVKIWDTTNSSITDLSDNYFTIAQACVPNWQCSGWSACVSGQQTKTCTDSNNCGTTANKPSETQTCTTNQPSITVTSPNGGQTWQMGQTYTISWSAVGMSAQDTVNVMLYSASSGNTGGYMIANITPANNGLYVWNIPSTIIGVLRPDNKFIIGVASTADPTNEDISDNYFTIAAAGDYCFQLYSKIDASYHKDCGETGYDPVADIDKNGRVSSGDETLYDAHKTDQTWCQQRLSETTSPCTTAYQSQLDFISNSVASIYQQLKYLLGQ